MWVLGPLGLSMMRALPNPGKGLTGCIRLSRGFNLLENRLESDVHSKKREGVPCSAPNSQSKKSGYLFHITSGLHQLERQNPEASRRRSFETKYFPPPQDNFQDMP